MKIQSLSPLLLAISLLSFQICKAETITGTFEILDLSSEISGEPALASDAARSSWQRACAEWKNETKELNKKNELIEISCETPSCQLMDSAKTLCTSTGTYKIKTAGTRVNNAPALVTQAPGPSPTAVPAPQPEVIVTPPPQIIVEETPAPRFGFVWIPGFWQWHTYHHVWVPGHWTHERPGFYWVHDHWSHHGHGWHFQHGYWAGRP